MPRDQFATVFTSSGSLQLAYQSFGSEDDPVFLLLTGWFSDLTLPEKDPLISPEALKLHMDAFPDSKLLVLEDIGHGVLPERHWAKMADAMRERML